MYAGLGDTLLIRAPRRLTPEEDAAARGDRLAVVAQRVAAGELDPTTAPYAGQPHPTDPEPGPYPVTQQLEPITPASSGAGVLLPLAAAVLAYFVI